MNFQDDFVDVPVLAILCDGEGFFIYEFSANRFEGTYRFAIGQFDNGARGVTMHRQSWLEHNTADHISRIRSSCDSLYYIFLRAYYEGLQGYWDRSIRKGRATGKDRETTPAWGEAKVLAKAAMDEAILAWNQWNDGRLSASRQMAEKALLL